MRVSGIFSEGNIKEYFYIFISYIRQKAQTIQEDS